MLFNSAHFGIFFPIVVTIYFLMPYRFRWAWLLFGSLYFYFSFIPIYTFLIIGSILFNYILGIKIEDAPPKNKKRLLILGLIGNLSVLAFFKYLNFLNTNLQALAELISWNYSIESFSIILPIGISFFTFQAIGYIVEVYRGNQAAERHLGILAVFITFFPQLVAGPIERSQNLLPQFREKHTPDPHLISNGLFLMLWGFFKKMVIADRLSSIVSHVYSNPESFNGISIVIATIFFAFQIYCDFSGYSDIAIGAAQTMGFRLMDNFNRPYFSKSISEFWSRWHISLSSWFRDYVYIPMGGNRKGKNRWTLNIFITFALSGLWHGAAWTFVFWGILNCVYLILSKPTARIRTHLAHVLGLDQSPTVLKLSQVASTFILICFSWIFFRANSFADAMTLCKGLFQGWGHLISNITNITTIRTEVFLGERAWDFMIAWAAIFFMEIVHYFQRHGNMRAMFSNKPIWMRWGIAYALIFWILFFGRFSEIDFIYFQF